MHAQKWDEISTYLQMRKSPVPYQHIAEICFVTNKDITLRALLKISNTDERVTQLVEMKFLEEAV